MTVAPVTAGCRTALYVSDATKAEPYWISPAAGGDLRPAVTVKEADGDGVAVTFTGLVADPPGKARRHFPQAELTLTVRVEAQSGDLLVHVAGRSPDTPVVGSAFGYTGLATRSINYSLAGSGLRLVGSQERGPTRPNLEWANVTRQAARAAAGVGRRRSGKANADPKFRRVGRGRRSA